MQTSLFFKKETFRKVYFLLNFTIFPNYRRLLSIKFLLYSPVFVNIVVAKIPKYVWLIIINIAII